MKLKLLLAFIFILGLSWTVTAQDDFPEDMLQDGDIELSNPDLALEIDFSDEDDWEFYEDNDGVVQVDTNDEVYLVEVEYTDDRAYLWGQDSREFSDVVIQIDTEQLSNEDNNGYGIMCRADPENTGYGYIFYISGDGFVSIFMNDEEDGIEQIYEWASSDAINQGEDENTLTVVCVGEYLGFYVNGELVAEVEDNTFEEGVIALAASIFEEDENVEIAFDNLLVWEVEGEGGNRNSGGRSNTSNPTNNNSQGDVDDLTNTIEDMLGAGDIEVQLNDVLLIETWDEIGEWDELDGDGYSSEVNDDRYVVREDAGLLAWGSNRTEHDDVVMNVEIERLSDGEASSFGMMCRVDPDNLSDGYSFIIASDGAYSIGYWDEDGYNPLLSNAFESSSDIDNDDTYEMTIVCVGEYLALYADGELIDEVEDDTYSQGYAGMAAISFDDDGIEVTFDNLVIWEGKD